MNKFSELELAVKDALKTVCSLETVKLEDITKISGVWIVKTKSPIAEETAVAFKHFIDFLNLEFPESHFVSIMLDENSDISFVPIDGGSLVKEEQKSKIA